MLSRSLAPSRARRRSPVLRRIARRCVWVHTFDIVGRSTAGTKPAPAQTRFALRRLTSVESVLQEAPGERSWPVLRLLARVPGLARRMRARRTSRYAARFAKGDIAYVAVDQREQAAAWAWVSLQPKVSCRWSGLRFRLQPGQAYLYDLWSFPEKRAEGAGTFVMRGMLADLHQSGTASYVFGYVLRDNRPSQVLHRLVLGFEQLQQVKDLRVLSRWAWQLPFTDEPRKGPCSRRPLPQLQEGLA